VIFALIKYRRFIGYAVAAAVLFASVWHIYKIGYETHKREVLAISAQSQIDSLKEVNDVKSKEQSIDDSSIDPELCKLGILRGGC